MAWVAGERSMSTARRKSGSVISITSLRLVSGTGFGLSSHGPHSMTPIDLEHPHENSDRDQGGAHPTQTVPEREQGWQDPCHLQERDRNIEDHPAESHQHEPEHESANGEGRRSSQWRETLQRPPARVLRPRGSALSERA